MTVNEGGVFLERLLYFNCCIITLAKLYGERAHYNDEYRIVDAVGAKGMTLPRDVDGRICCDVRT